MSVDYWPKEDPWECDDCHGDDAKITIAYDLRFMESVSVSLCVACARKLRDQLTIVLTQAEQEEEEAL